MKKFWHRTKAALAGPQKSVPTTNSVPWQRILLSLTGIAVIIFMWRWATFHLYVLPVTSIAAFTSITNNALYVIAALVIFFVTGKVIYDWKNATVSQVVEQAESYTEQRTVAPKQYDDLATIP